MQLVSCHGGTLRTLSVRGLAADRARSFATGLPAIDALTPNQAFACGAVHELLHAPRHPSPRSVALLLARSAIASAGGIVVWSDPQRTLYPPALAAAGLPLERLFLLYPKNEADELWALAECLRSRGVAVTVAAPKRLSRLGARRLQLAAEVGGGVGVLLRNARHAQHYAAVTRWMVAPTPGERTLQRWRLELVHGHGGQIGKAVILEVRRETNHLSASEAVADRPVTPQVARVPA